MSELGLTKEMVADILTGSGITKNSKWRGYTKAKKIIFQGKWLKDSKEYDQIIRWITDYLNI